MALQGSGPIKLSEVQTEFGGTDPISLSEYYAAEGSLPTTGAISIGDFYGLSDGIIVHFDLFAGGGAGGGGGGDVYGGGGGGGARVTATNASGEIVSGTEYTFEIGMGGAPSAYRAIGGNGRNTSILDIGLNGLVAKGGGGGGGSNRYIDALFTSPGTYIWRVPEGVTSITAICVGGGGGGGGCTDNNRGAAGGGGGALRYKNNFAVTPGKHLQVTVGAGGSGGTGGGSGTDGGTSIIREYDLSVTYLQAFGGEGGGGAATASASSVGAGGGTDPSNPLDAYDGGGNGGDGGVGGANAAGGGGGGAAGYSGNGGRGGQGNQNDFVTAGTGGGGGGGGTSNTAAGGGGGVGIYGEGASGPAGGAGSGGAKGSDGGAGGNGSNGGGAGGQFGGGGGSGGDDDSNHPGAAGGGGAVRIVFGQPAGSDVMYPSSDVLEANGWDIDVDSQDDGQPGGCGGGGSWSGELDKTGSDHAGQGGQAPFSSGFAMGYTFVDVDSTNGRNGGLAVNFGGGGGGLGSDATSSSGAGGAGTSFNQAGFAYTNVGQGGDGGGGTRATQQSFAAGGHGASPLGGDADEGNNGAIAFEYASSLGYTQIRAYTSTVYTSTNGNNREYVVYPTPGNRGVPTYNGSYTIEKEVLKMAWDRDPDSLPIWQTTDDSYQTITGFARTDALLSNRLTGFTNNEGVTSDTTIVSQDIGSGYGGGWSRETSGTITNSMGSVAPYYSQLCTHNSSAAIYLNQATPTGLSYDTSKTTTYEGWFKVNQFPQSENSTDYILSYGDDLHQTSNANGWALKVVGDYDGVNGHVVFDSVANTATHYHMRQDPYFGTTTGLDPQPIKADTWFHLCLVFNLGDITVYINGISQGTINLLGIPDTTVDDHFVIFGSWDAAGNGTVYKSAFLGQVQDFRIYDTVKYSSEFFVPLGHGLPI